MDIIFGYFDQHLGPVVFYTHPNPIDTNLAEFIQKLMDIESVNQFFKYETEKGSKITLLNYLFQIPSLWGRGRIELVMLSATLEQRMDLYTLEYSFKEFAKRFQETPDLYKIFYSRSQSDPEVLKIKQTFFGLIQDFHQNLEMKVDQLTLINKYFEQTPITSATPENQVHLAVISTFITTIDARTPTGAVLLHNIGVRVARKCQGLFQSTSHTKLIGELRTFWARQGFGKITTPFKEPTGYAFKIWNSFECIQYPDLGQTMCKFSEGFFTEIFQLRISDKIYVKELECIATGNDCCKFVIWDGMG